MLLIYTACSPTCTKFIWCSYRSLIDTLASEVKCLRVIERRDRSKQRAEYLQKRDDILSQETRLKPERAQGRSRKEKGLCTPTQILNLSNLLKGSDIKRTSRRTVLLKGSDIKRTSRRTALLKGSDIKRTSRKTALLKGSNIKRTSRRTALLKGRNTRTIQLPLRHLKGIGIGMTPLSDWLKLLPRGNGIAGVTELPLPPKGMSWHVVLH